MSIIEKLPAIIRDARNEYNTILAKTPASLKITESVRTADQARNDSQPEGIIYAGDNIELIGAMLNGEAPGFGNLRGKVQVVYIDPPFYTKARYTSSVRTEGMNPSTLHQEAYTDVWSEGAEEYLRMLCIRFFAIRDLLSDTGSLWVHLDWHIVHYVKILLDEIFGADNFVNEIIWNYKSGGASKRHFARKHDTLLFYSKTSSYYLDIPKEKSYNRGFAPYRFKGVTEYQDEIGWYTLVNMKDVWQLDMVGRTASERTGYATQKPEALLSRILESCSKPGDIVCDFFGGSGTTAAVAAINDRKFISADTGSLAIASERRRLAAAGINFDIIKGNRGVQNSALELEAMDNCINLRGYNPGDLSSLGLDTKSEELAREILKSDSLALIAYWAVDTAYDGSVFRPGTFVLPGKNGLARSLGYARPAGSQGSGLAVLAVDIFGTETLKVIK